MWEEEGLPLALTLTWWQSSSPRAPCTVHQRPSITALPLHDTTLATRHRHSHTTVPPHSSVNSGSLALAAPPTAPARPSFQHCADVTHKSELDTLHTRRDSFLRQRRLSEECSTRDAASAGLPSNSSRLHHPPPPPTTHRYAALIARSRLIVAPGGEHAV